MSRQIGIFSDVDVRRCQERVHAASRDTHIPGVIYIYLCVTQCRYVASRHQPTVPPIGLSLGAAGLPTCRRVADNDLAAACVSFAPCHQQQNTQPPAILCLPAADGRFDRSTSRSGRWPIPRLFIAVVACGQDIRGRSPFLACFRAFWQFFSCCDAPTTSHTAPVHS